MFPCSCDLWSNYKGLFLLSACDTTRNFGVFPEHKVPLARSLLSLPLVSFIYLHLEGAQRGFYSETNGALCPPLPYSCCVISPLGVSNSSFVKWEGCRCSKGPSSPDILRLYYTFWISSHIGMVLPWLLNDLLSGITVKLSITLR